MLDMPPKILNISPSGKINVFISTNSNLKSTQHDLNTNTNNITTTSSVEKLHHQTNKLFPEQKDPQNIKFKNHKVASPFSHCSLYSLDHLITIGTFRNYDPIKQYYILSPFHDPTPHLFVPQEALNLNDDFLLPTHIPTNVQISFRECLD